MHILQFHSWQSLRSITYNTFFIWIVQIFYVLYLFCLVQNLFFCVPFLIPRRDALTLLRTLPAPSYLSKCPAPAPSPLQGALQPSLYTLDYQFMLNLIYLLSFLTLVFLLPLKTRHVVQQQSR